MLWLNKRGGHFLAIAQLTGVGFKRKWFFFFRRKCASHFDIEM